MKQKIVIIFISFLFLTKLSAEPKIQAPTAILMDYNSGKILFERDADHQIYPASMTKIMTAIIVFDLLKQEKIKLSDEFIISENAWRMSKSGYSSMFIMLNDKVSIEDLLRGIIVVSGNDACVALAEGIAGTETAFADMMNEKAEEIGLVNTNFTNSSGINDPDNYSTVRDILIMSNYLIKNYPNFYEMYKETSFTWDRTGGDPITQGNRNPLLYKNFGADGIKTGYTNASGFNLVASVERNGQRIIGVVFGGKTARTRDKHMVKLLNKFIKTPVVRTAKLSEIPSQRPDFISYPVVKKPKNFSVYTVSESEDWFIQIGAFKNKLNAHIAAKKARNAAPEQLGNLPASLQKINKPLENLKVKKPLWRVRFIELAENQARSVCAELWSSGLSCIPLPEKSLN